MGLYNNRIHLLCNSNEPIFELVHFSHAVKMHKIGNNVLYFLLHCVILVLSYLLLDCLVWVTDWLDKPSAFPCCLDHQHFSLWSSRKLLNNVHISQSSQWTILLAGNLIIPSVRGCQRTPTYSAAVPMVTYYYMS